MKITETCVIYLRKSTNTEDKQTISLDTQREYCEDLAKKHGFRVVEKLEEKRSAKESGKRPLFTQMVKMCKKGGIDYVVAYDPTRISRDTMDAALFTDLINKKLIKGFYSADTGSFFDGMNIFSAMMLGISFLMSRADNQMRSSNVKNKMKTKFEDGYVMTKLPFGYKKIVYLDADGVPKKKFQIKAKEGALVKMAFQMRVEGKTTPQIAKYFTDEGCKKDAGTIDKILHNEFYSGIQDNKFGRIEISTTKNIGYKALISPELFEKVNGIGRVYKRERNVSFPAYFRKLIFDMDEIPLTPYRTVNKYDQEYTYYRAQNRSRFCLNISEEKIFETADKYMEKFDNLPPEVITTFNQKLTARLHEGKIQLSKATGVLQKQINVCEEKIGNLDDKYALNKIDDDLYMELRNGYLDDKRLMEAKIKRLRKENEDLQDFINNLVKLIVNLSQTYKRGTLEEKSRILKSIQVKLFVDDAGIVYTKENPMLEALGFQSNLYYGDVTENRTPIAGMRIPRPNR